MTKAVRTTVFFVLSLFFVCNAWAGEELNTAITKSFLTGLLRCWWLFALAIGFFILREYLKTPKVKGKIGEKVTDLGLKLTLDPKTYTNTDFKITF